MTPRSTNSRGCTEGSSRGSERGSSVAVLPILPQQESEGPLQLAPAIGLADDPICPRFVTSASPSLIIRPPSPVSIPISPSSSLLPPTLRSHTWTLRRRYRTTLTAAIHPATIRIAYRVDTTWIHVYCAHLYLWLRCTEYL